MERGRIFYLHRERTLQRQESCPEEKEEIVLTQVRRYYSNLNNNRKPQCPYLKTPGSGPERRVATVCGSDMVTHEVGCLSGLSI